MLQIPWGIEGDFRGIIDIIGKKSLFLYYLMHQEQTIVLRIFQIAIKMKLKKLKKILIDTLCEEDDKFMGRLSLWQKYNN